MEAEYATRKPPWLEECPVVPESFAQGMARVETGRVPALCGEILRTSPGPSERGQAVGHPHSKHVFAPSSQPLG
jgi:hypothetical protein